MDAVIHFERKPLSLNSKFILPLAMLFITASLTADTLAYKFWEFGPFLESGATLVFPFTYVIGDILAEVYGYSIAKKIIWVSFGCEILFSSLVTIIIKLKSPENISNQFDYHEIFSNILRFVIFGIFSDLSSSFLNIYIISKYKIVFSGRAFILRSLASTAIGELIMNVMLCFLAFIGFTSIRNVFHITVSAYILEIIYACVFVIPAKLICDYLKKKEKIDAYDTGINYNIFRS